MGLPGIDPNAPLDDEAWKAFFARYETVVLVANSAETDVEALKARFDDKSLFVFFNAVFRVLPGHFDHCHSILVTRSAPDGANLVRKQEVAKVVSYLQGDRFHGIVNLRAGADETFSPPADFGYPDIAYLDLADVLAADYPQGSKPTSGYALAHWMIRSGIGTQIVLAGFTKTKSVDMDVNMFAGHDWYFEQVMEELFARHGKLSRFEGPSPRLAAFERLADELDFVDRNEIALVGAHVAENRLAALTPFVEGAWKSTRFLRRIRDARNALRRRGKG